jgi:uncharacterized DUF497 family protein
LRFIWDEQNLTHLADHRVAPETAEAVFFADDREIRLSPVGYGRYECEGTSDGRLHRLIFTVLDEETLYPISCFPIRRRRVR